MMQFDAVHITGAIVTIFAIVMAGISIRRFCEVYEHAEIMWVPWWLVIAFLVGDKFF